MSQEFTHFADRVRTMLGEGATLAAIGGEVDSWPLPEEERSALWLFAWAGRPRRSAVAAQRRMYQQATSTSANRQLAHGRSCRCATTTSQSSERRTDGRRSVGRCSSSLTSSTWHLPTDPAAVRVFYEGTRPYPGVWRVALLQAGFDVPPLEADSSIAAPATRSSGSPVHGLRRRARAQMT
jgi:hypothetical protein